MVGRTAWLTISFVCLMIFAAVLFPLRGAGGGGEHAYVGVKKCRSCHKKVAIGDQYGKWLEGPHAKAWESLASEKAKRWASEAGVADAQQDEKCVRCHVTAFDAPPALAAKLVAEDGVGCEACHGAGKDYRKKKVMIDRDLSLAKGLVIPTEATCTRCHNDESPGWDPHGYTTADGRKVGFDFDAAVKRIAHPVPADYDPSQDSDEDDE